MKIDDNVLTSLLTIGDMVRWAASQFTKVDVFHGHGHDNPLDEAFYLVTHSLHLPHDIPQYMVHSNLTRQEKVEIIQLVQQRVETRLPLPYLLNEAWFAGRPYFVDQRVLIPRSPIAELIAESFEPWVDADHVSSILDLCTGSGCIAIACALAFPQANCLGSDIETGALEVANINAKKHQVTDQVKFIQSNLFESIDASLKFDIIVSNPPYVNAADMSNLPTEFCHEPTKALAGGHDGLDIVLKILQFAKGYLHKGGILVVEVGSNASVLVERLPKVPFTWLEFEHGGEGVFLLTESQIPESLTD